MIFSFYTGIIKSLATKYLAYFIVLAGWLFFCYWLYSTKVYPRFHPGQPIEWPVFDQDQEIPLAFKWGSDVSIAGKAFDQWSSEIKRIEAGRNILRLRGYYFLDEAPAAGEGTALARRRLERMIDYLEIEREKIIAEVIRKDIDADVKSKAFEALDYEEVPVTDLIYISGDTAEICFPLKDSLSLPEVVFIELETWIAGHEEVKTATTYLTGIADGTGIAESSDMAMERALVIKDYLLNKGWNEERITLSTGQRNEPFSIRNRCVVIYYE